MDPRILIIGKNSFIGQNYKIDTTHQYVETVSMLERNVDDIDFTLYDAVLHLAAIVHQKKGIPDSKYFEINTNLAYEVARSAKEANVKHFIFFSTIRVYGEYTTTESWRENSATKPKDPYGVSKLKAEQKILELADDQFKVSILRIPMVYGPGVKGNMLKLIKYIDRSFLIPFGNIKNVRNILYIRNLVDFVDLLIEKNKSGIFIVSNPDSVSTTQIVREIKNGLKKNRLILNVPLIFQKFIKIIWNKRYYKIFGDLRLDNKKSFDTIGYIPKYSIEDGFKDMMIWYNKQK